MRRGTVLRGLQPQRPPSPVFPALPRIAAAGPIRLRRTGTAQRARPPAQPPGRAWAHPVPCLPVLGRLKPLCETRQRVSFLTGQASPQFRAQRRRHIPPQMQEPVVEQIQKLLKCRVPGPHPLPHQQGHMRRQRPIHARQPKQIHIKARARPSGKATPRTSPAGMLSEAGTPQSIRPFHASRIALACQTSKRHGADRKRDRASPPRSAEARRIADTQRPLYGYRFSAQAA